MATFPDQEQDFHCLQVNSQEDQTHWKMIEMLVRMMGDHPPLVEQGLPCLRLVNTRTDPVT